METIDLKIIGESIQASRKKLRMTQNDFAKKFGLSRKSIGNLERGVSLLSENKMNEIYDYIAEQNRHEPLESIIDYIRITFQTHNVDIIFNDVLKIKKEFFAVYPCHALSPVYSVQNLLLSVLICIFSFCPWFSRDGTCQWHHPRRRRTRS